MSPSSSSTRSFVDKGRGVLGRRVRGGISWTDCIGGVEGFSCVRRVKSRRGACISGVLALSELMRLIFLGGPKRLVGFGAGRLSKLTNSGDEEREVE